MRYLLLLLLFVSLMLNSCDSSTAEENLYEGIKKTEQQDLKGALKFFDKAIKINPEYSEAYLQRGRAKFNLKDIDGALTDFASAINFNKAFAAAYYNRGTVYVYMRDIDNACKDFIKAKELNYPNMDDKLRMCNK